MIIADTIKISNTKPTLKSIGENTHHQDQVITLVNFKIKKIIVSVVPNPNPL